MEFLVGNHRKDDENEEDQPDDPGNDAGAHPIFTYLKENAQPEAGKGFKAKASALMFKLISKSVEKDNDIKWNFTKFLINRDGTVIKRFEPTTTPEAIEKDIREML